MASRPEIEGDPVAIYTATRRIADLAFQFYDSTDTSEDKYWLTDQREQSVNPRFSQTTGGLFLFVYFGAPGNLWTPWGEWNCWGGSGGNGGGELCSNSLKSFLAAIDCVELHIPEKQTREECFGPVYAIRKIGDIELPKPELRPRLSYLEYADAKHQWEELTTQYKEEQ